MTGLPTRKDHSTLSDLGESNTMADLPTQVSESFHRFRDLPTELRLLVWEHYAIPPDPLLHVFAVDSYGKSTLVSVPIGYHVDIDLAIDIRSITQVSHEARIGVLKGREMVPCRRSINFLKPMRKWSCSGAYNSFFFVDWNVDLIYVRWCRASYKIRRGHLEPFWPNVRNLAVECFSSPEHTSSVPVDPLNLFYEIEDSALYEQLRRITFVIDDYRIPEEGDPFHDPPLNLREVFDMFWQCPTAKNKSGLHPIGITVHDCYCTRCFKRQVLSLRPYLWDNSIHKLQDQATHYFTGVFGRPVAVDMAFIHPDFARPGGHRLRF